MLVAVFAGPKRAGQSEAASWTFEPFSRSARVAGGAGWLRGTSGDTANDPVSLPAPGFLVPAGPRDKIVTYIVQSGDTLSNIARGFNVRTETLMWSNNIAEADLISPGVRLKVPPTDGVIHTVQTGETINSIVALYTADLAAFRTFAPNMAQEGNAVQAGREVFVPGGTPPRPVVTAAPARPAEPPARAADPASAAPPVATAAPAPAVAPVPARPTEPPAPAVPPPPGARLGYPAAGDLTQRYGGGHGGIDIVTDYGNPIYAAGPGTVVNASMGWNGGFGNMVEIDHGNGVVSRYAHMSAINVSPGQRVNRGQLIGQIGTSGIVTAPHVHFEVLQNGARTDPMLYLR